MEGLRKAISDNENGWLEKRRELWVRFEEEGGVRE